MTIRVLSFDFDGCLFFERHMNASNVVEKNYQFLKGIKDENTTYPQSIVFVGSNRQDRYYDNLNLWKNNTGSCFPAIQAIATHLDVTLDQLLLADIYQNEKPGTEFQRALKEETSDGPKWEFDASKEPVILSV